MRIPMPFTPETLATPFIEELIREMDPGARLSDARVLQIKKFGQENVSTSARVTFELQYRNGSANQLPTRILAKMTMGDGPWRGLHRHFRNEVEFYQRLRPTLDIETPRSVGARYDHETSHFIVLLEDLSQKSAHFNSMGEEPKIGDLEGILDTYARLHAQFWNSPRLEGDLSWVPTHIDGELEAAMRGPIARATLNELAANNYKRELLQITGMSASEAAAGIWAVKQHFSTLQQTLLHGDGHYNNTYRLPDGTGGIYDWQCFSRGHCIHDVAYLITTALSIERRRQHERELLSYYADRLAAHGVKDVPDADSMWLSHRRMSLWAFYLGWLCASTVGYGLDITMTAFLRTCIACQDHETKKLIADLV